MVFAKKGAVHGFRRLSVFIITATFEHLLAKLKTNFDEIVNSRQHPPGIVSAEHYGRICRGRIYPLRKAECINAFPTLKNKAPEEIFRCCCFC